MAASPDLFFKKALSKPNNNNCCLYELQSLKDTVRDVAKTDYKDFLKKKEFLSIIDDADFETIISSLELKDSDEKKQKRSERQQTKLNIKQNTKKIESLVKQLLSIDSELKLYNTKLKALEREKEMLFENELDSTIDCNELITDEFGCLDLNDIGNIKNNKVIMNMELCTKILKSQNHIMNNLEKKCDELSIHTDMLFSDQLEIEKYYTKLSNQIRTQKNYALCNFNSSLYANNDVKIDDENESKKNRFRIKIENDLESIKRILSIQKASQTSQELLIDVLSGNIIYTIDVEFKSMEYKNDYIKSIRVIPQTSRDENNSCVYIDDILSTNSSINEVNDLDKDDILLPSKTIESIVLEILLRIKKLPKRNFDVNELENKFSGNVMYNPQSSEIMIDFTFRNDITPNLFEMEDHDDDSKMDDLPKSVEVQMSWLINLSWDYPKLLHKDVDSLITITNYNISINDKIDSNVAEIIQNKWQTVSDAIVKELKGKDQNNLVVFVGKLYNKLKNSC